MSIIYKANPNFSTELDEEFAQGDTEMIVKDISEKYIPNAYSDEPQLLTLIDRELEIIETIEYNGKDVDTNKITGITREIEVVGFDSTDEGRTWDAGTIVGRSYTAYEQNETTSELKLYRGIINRLLGLVRGNITDTEPSNPDDGDLWLERSTGTLYEYDDDSSSWVERSMGSKGSTVISTNPPADVEDGIKWFDLDTGEFKLYRDDDWEVVLVGSHDNEAHDNDYTIGDYEIQKNGTDDTGIINFKT